MLRWKRFWHRQVSLNWNTLSLFVLINGQPNQPQGTRILEFGQNNEFAIVTNYDGSGSGNLWLTYGGPTAVLETSRAVLTGLWIAVDLVMNYSTGALQFYLPHDAIVRANRESTEFGPIGN